MSRLPRSFAWKDSLIGRQDKGKGENSEDPGNGDTCWTLVCAAALYAWVPLSSRVPASALEMQAPATGMISFHESLPNPSHVLA